MINSESNSRKLDRRSVQQEVCVRDSLTGVKLGHLANIHSEGFMLFGDEGVQESHLYQLSMEFKEPVNGATSLSVGAECLWLNGSGDNSQCWAGFQIIDISDEGKGIIALLVSDLDG